MDTLLFWHGVLVECGVALGIEAALLLGLAVLAQRPRVERLAALLPAAGNMLAFTLARSVQASADEWQRYIAFQFAHYDPRYWSTFNRDNAQVLVDAVAAAQRSGIVMLLLSEVLLFFGAFCILAWLGKLDWLERLVGPRWPPRTYLPTTMNRSRYGWSRWSANLPVRAERHPCPCR